MYTSATTRPDGLPIVDEATAWEIALDATLADHERIPAVWTLFFYAPLASTAERLLPLLQERSLWLGSEVVEVVRAIGAAASVKVGGVSLDEVDAVDAALGERRPWARHPRRPADPPSVIIAFRGGSIVVDYAPPSPMPPTMQAHGRIKNAGYDFPWGYFVLPVGEALCFGHMTGVDLGLVVALDRGKIGVLSYKPLKAVVVDASPDMKNHPFQGWRVYSIDEDTFAVRGGLSLPSSSS